MVWQSAHIVVRLDNCRLTEAALDDICVDCSLCKEINCAYLLRFLFEHSDEFLTDDLTLRLWVCYASELCIVSLLSIYTHEVEVVLTLAAKYLFDMVSLVLTE